MTAGRIRVGVGGWVFEPWRESFYPKSVKQKDELAYMSRHVTAIEINSTYYSMQSPATFAKWAGQAPDGFKFTIKGSRYCTNRRELAGAGEGLGRFMGQGLVELGDKLGPLLWQFMGTKKFDPEDFKGFLGLLPGELGGRRLQHAVEVRHDSFCTPQFIDLAREHGVAVVFADHATYPGIWDITSDFVYLRLQTGSDDIPTAYSPDALDVWAGRMTHWSQGGAPEDLEPVDSDRKAAKTPRDVFAFVIHEGKVRAPAAAQALIERLGPEHRPAGD